MTVTKQGISVPEDLFTKFRRLCVLLGTKISTRISHLIKKDVEQHKSLLKRKNRPKVRL